ncbi:MAG: Alpha/Beta hydrolase protein [Monoraphidium minutum]|nr:MAG: Alpha/Beta hydrolase protein [Monoraphidium minutum]
MGRPDPPSPPAAAAASVEPAAAPPPPPADQGAAAELLRTADRVHALPCGRVLSYVDCGDASSADCVLMMALALHAAAKDLRLRLVAPDRPGYGGSTPAPGRAVADFVADAAHLLAALGVARFGVLGSSAGSMYALALTRDPETRSKIAGRVTLLPPWIPPGSLPPGSKAPWSLSLLCYAPRPATALFVGLSGALVARRLRGEGARVADVMTRSKPHEVAAFTEDPANDAFYRAMISEWARPGCASATADEMLLCAEAGPGRRLGFSYMSDLPEAGVRVFAGSEDALVAAEAVRAWAEAAGGGGRVELVEVEGGTHDGMVHTHKRAALAALARDLRA